MILWAHCTLRPYDCPPSSPVTFSPVSTPSQSVGPFFGCVMPNAGVGSGGALRGVLPDPGHERNASGHQRYASDVTELFPPHQDLLGHYEQRNHDDPEHIHDACHEQ